MQRNLAGLDDSTWLLARKFGRKYNPENMDEFSGLVLESAPGLPIAVPDKFNPDKTDPTGLANWQLAARVQADNIKQATKNMSALLGNTAWQKNLN